MKTTETNVFQFCWSILSRKHSEKNMEFHQTEEMFLDSEKYRSKQDLVKFWFIDFWLSWLGK